MTKGQTTVAGLLILLLALEAVRNATIKNFLSSALSGFKNAINSTGPASTGTTSATSASGGSVNV